MTEPNIEPGATTNERNSLYGCKFCPSLGKGMKTRSAILDGKHNQNVYRAMRGHSVECRSKVLASGAKPADVSAAPVKLCGYCLKSFADAHIAGDHSLSCADGPTVAAAREAEATKAAKPAKVAKPRRRQKKGKAAPRKASKRSKAPTSKGRKGSK